MDDLEKRVREVEKCIPELSGKVAAVDSKASMILSIVQELQKSMVVAGERSTELLLALARFGVRMDSAEKRLDEVEDIAQSNRLALAKSLLLGGGGGLIGSIITFILSKILEKVF